MKTNAVLLLTLAIMILNILAGSVTASTNEDVIKFLKSTKEHSETIIVDGALLKISNALIMEAKIGYNLSDNSWGGNLTSIFFFKNGDKLTPVNTDKPMIPTTKEFISSIKKSFSLKTNEDALSFQTMLSAFDRQAFSKGYYQSGNNWYFVRSEMFGDKSGFLVTTDDAGKVQNIEYISKFEVEIPETKDSGEKEKYNEEEVLELMLITFTDIIQAQLDEGSKEDIFAAPAPKVNPSEDDSKEMQKIAGEFYKHRFEADVLKSENLALISNASIYRAALVVDQSTPEYKSESRQNTTVIEYKGEFSRVSNLKSMFSNDLFLKSIKSDFSLKKESNITAFNLLLDELDPGEKDAIETIKKDNVIAYIREKSFDDKMAYLLLLDKKGKIIAIDYNDYTEKSILKLKAKDPNYKVDFAFKLVKPASTKITISADETIPVEITFDEKSALVHSAWLLTQVDGKMMGMEVDSEGINTPFTDEIPGKYLKSGKHIVEYILMPPGNDTKRAFAKITIEVEVK